MGKIISTETDRQLLELAAKAAGMGTLAQWDKEYECIKYQFKSELTDGHLWNPLKDDGDALRLAVKLNLFIDINNGSSGAQALNVAFCSDLHGLDPYAATRRAIVRAAAAIAKLMP